MTLPRITIARSTRFLVLGFFALLLPLAGCQTGGLSLPSLSLPRGDTQDAQNAPHSAYVTMVPPQPEPSGPPAHCTATGGTAKFNGQLRAFRPVDFSLPPNMHVNVGLTPVKGAGGKGAGAFRAWFDPTGQKMVFCPVVTGPPDKKIACASLYVLDEDLGAGVKRTFDVPNAIQGGEIICAYDKKKLR